MRGGAGTVVASGLELSSIPKKKTTSMAFPCLSHSSWSWVCGTPGYMVAWSANIVARVKLTIPERETVGLEKN